MGERGEWREEENFNVEKRVADGPEESMLPSLSSAAAVYPPRSSLLASDPDDQALIIFSEVLMMWQALLWDYDHSRSETAIP